MYVDGKPLCCISFLAGLPVTAAREAKGRRITGIFEAPRDWFQTAVNFAVIPRVARNLSFFGPSALAIEPATDEA